MKTLAIIASGPSLIRSDVDMVEKSGIDIMGINNAYQITQKMKYHYACDTKWWRAHWNKIYPGPERYSMKDEREARRDRPDKGIPGVYQMQMGERQGLSREWPVICWGGNSGYQAINLAYLLGYRRMILLGYDMKLNGKKAHWHRDHNFAESTNPVKGTFSNWLRDFKVLADEAGNAGLKIMNATRDTALTCFPRVELEDVL